MQKLIIDNKKFSLLVAIVVGIVFISGFSNAPRVAQAPEDNLAAVGVTSDVLPTEPACLASNKYTPAFNSDRIRFDKYNVEIVIPGAKSITFSLNINDRTTSPAGIANVNFDGTYFGFNIVDQNILNQLASGQSYTVNVDTVTDSDMVSLEPNTRTIIATCPEVVPTVTPADESVPTNPIVTQRTGFLGFVDIVVERIRGIGSAIGDFFSNLFGGSESQRFNSGGTGAEK